jgi:hypothetical protein
VKLSSPLDTLSFFKTNTRGRWDMVNPLAILGLGIFGVFFIYSAQLSVGGTNWIIQLIWLTGGAAIYVTVSLIDYRFWLSVAHWFYGLAMLPLLIVLIPGIGSERLLSNPLKQRKLPFYSSRRASSCAPRLARCVNPWGSWANWHLRWVSPWFLSCYSPT